jgi:hypothetical protein
MIDDGQTGYVYPVGDIGRLIQRLEQLQQDLNTRPQVIQRAVKEKSDTYSMRVATDGLLAALANVTTSSSTTVSP